LEVKKKHQVDVSQVKAKIKEMKAAQEEARKKGDKKWVEIYRKRIKRHKRITRNM